MNNTHEEVIKMNNTHTNDAIDWDDENEVEYLFDELWWEDNMPYRVSNWDGSC